MTHIAPRRAVAITLCAVAAVLVVRAVTRPATGAQDAASAVATVVDVHVDTVRKATLRAYVTAYGRVEPEPAAVERPAAQAFVAAAVPGRIVEARCVEGQVVEAGALLFQLDSRLADLAVGTARSALDLARRNAERQHALADVGGTSEKLVLEADQALEAARAQLGDAETRRSLLRVTAPIAGTVTRVLGKPGQPVDPSTVLAEVIDLDRVVVEGSIPSAEAPRLALGQAVEITDEDGALAATGTVALIVSRVDPGSDSVPVRVELPAGVRLRPGQFVRLRIVTEQHEDCLAVPVESLVRTAEGSVIAIVEDDTARRRPVREGLHDGDLVEVDGPGLKAGMTVVTEGAYGLPAETSVRIVRQP